jgi:hypothetical protein
MALESVFENAAYFFGRAGFFSSSFFSPAGFGRRLGISSGSAYDGYPVLGDRRPSAGAARERARARHLCLCLVVGRDCEARARA